MSITLETLSGCTGDLSTLDPAGPAARSIATLWWGMLIAFGAIFALVMMLLALAFRPAGTGPTWAAGEKLWIIGLGLVFPALILLCLLAYGLWIGERLVPRSGAEVMRIEAEARKWSWRFSYDHDARRSTENVLHIPAGRPVDIAITTADVIHSFWVPRLAGKLDAIPGHVNVLRIEADAPGTYAGVSAEFSGRGYDNHRFSVIAHEAEDWQRFLEGEQ
ncbi:cytochrome B [Hoeflea sp. YIM 152468]|uniref:cytochrome c oxidase subunit II n=1 Tax=Hoeflea sp. YIM 152468 TaxID=3031759 RepID=UPI0023DB77E9|nr:cytochrome B [Hoeflea sp. YIM 152468]MDF1609397.1 cytochrome B [Hoeflea sp. YIM 152468]